MYIYIERERDHENLGVAPFPDSAISNKMPINNVGRNPISSHRSAIYKDGDDPRYIHFQS